MGIVIIRASLKRDFCWKYQHLSFRGCFLSSFVKVSVSSSNKSQTLGGQRKIYLLFMLVYVMF